MARSTIIRYIHDLPPVKEYHIIYVARLRHPMQKHFIIHVWEDDESIGKYILPLHVFFCQNEIIQIDLAELICTITFLDTLSFI